MVESTEVNPLVVGGFAEWKKCELESEEHQFILSLKEQL